MWVNPRVGWSRASPGGPTCLPLSLSLSCFSLFSFHGAHASGARLPFLYSRGESRMQRRDPASRTSIRHCRRDIPAAEPTRMKNSSQPGSYIGALTAGNLHPPLDPPRSVYRYAAILYARRRRPREIPKREMLERIRAHTRLCTRRVRTRSSCICTRCH